MTVKPALPAIWCNKMQKIKHYLLDLTHCPTPRHIKRFEPFVLLLHTGRYNFDFELNEEAMPGIRGHYKIGLLKDNPDEYAHLNKILPIGFNKRDIPFSAQLAEVK